MQYSQIIFIFFGLFLVVKNQWICDDGYIYFRYVDNLVVHKIGLVFNRGEFVEGFTSPLWALLLCGLRFLFPLIELRHLVFVLGWVISILVFFILVHINNKVLQIENNSKKCLFNLSLPLILTISTYFIPGFFTSGLETPLVILYSVLVATQILTPSNNPIYIGLLIGIGPLIRPDLCIFSLLVFLHCFFRLDRLPSCDLMKTIIIGAIPNISYLVFRIWYYASLLPNTYYAKVSDNYLKQGMFYLMDLILAYPVHILGGILILFIFLRKSTILKNRILLISGILIYSFYVLWIGGDFMHGRFWLPGLILFYISLSGLFEPVLNRLAMPFSRVGLQVINVGIVLLIVFLLTPFRPIQEKEEIINRIVDEREWYLSQNSDKLSEWNFEPTISWAVCGKYLKKLSDKHKTTITVVTGSIGYLGYYAGPNVIIIDKWGLVSPIAARKRLDERGIPGHEKSLPIEYIFLRKPDLIICRYLPIMFKPYEIFEEENKDKIKIVQKWVVKNKSNLDLIDSQIHNQHDFFKNIYLALKTHPVRFE